MTQNRDECYHPIDRCRVCGNEALIPVLDLGDQALTGHFPAPSDPPVPVVPLQLVKCHAASPTSHCGLLQLRHSCAPRLLYGANYGYRSGLNRSMVDHLQSKVSRLADRIDLRPGDLIVDVGSNDGTLLSTWPEDIGLVLLGIDPAAEKFRRFYRSDIKLVVDFFSESAIHSEVPGKKVRVLTSIAMFYDLESPLEFMRQVAANLAPDGLWHFEQSYLPTMLSRNAYDTVCHEHLEYYSLQQIDWMARRAGLKLLDVEFNDVNGGSFAVTASLSTAPWNPDVETLQTAFRGEGDAGLGTLEPYQGFAHRIEHHSGALRRQLRGLKDEGKLVLGYGASTKGNVILQYCGISTDLLPAIADVNPDKFGSTTPGTRIPIIPEDEARSRGPDFFLVLPWHFRDGILVKESAFRESGGRFIFPLPTIEIV